MCVEGVGRLNSWPGTVATASQPSLVLPRRKPGKSNTATRTTFRRKLGDVVAPALLGKRERTRRTQLPVDADLHRPPALRSNC